MGIRGVGQDGSAISGAIQLSAHAAATQKPWITAGAIWAVCGPSSSEITGYGRKPYNSAGLSTKIFCRSAAFGAQSSIRRSEEHTSELQSLMRISYAVFCLKK